MFTSEQVLDRLQSILPGRKRPGLRTLQRYADLGLVPEPNTYYEKGQVGRSADYDESVVAEFYAAHILINKGPWKVNMTKLPAIRRLALAVESERRSRQEWYHFLGTNFYALPAIWQWLIEKKRIEADLYPGQLLGMSVVFRETDDGYGFAEAKLAWPDKETGLPPLSVY